MKKSRRRRVPNLRPADPRLRVRDALDFIEFRRRRNISQDKLAKMLHVCRKTVCNVETGSHGMSPIVRERFRGLVAGKYLRHKIFFERARKGSIEKSHGIEKKLRDVLTDEIRLDVPSMLPEEEEEEENVSWPNER